MFVDDIVQANLLAATQPAAEGEIFNIGTGVGSSLNELIAIPNQVSGRNNPVIYTDPGPGRSNTVELTSTKPARRSAITRKQPSRKAYL